MSAFLRLLERRSLAILIGLTVFFAGLETFYALHRPLSYDEFNFAWCAVQVTDGIPYADFEPYKPVLGTYIQLALLNLGADTWSGFLVVRLGMTYLTVITLFLGALWLRRTFRADGVCLAYGLLVVMTSLVEWAIEVRLDMLTALFGFVSLLLLLDQRVALAGVLAGFSFLISQKGTMYALAGGAGLTACLIIHRNRHAWRDLLVYGGCVVLPIAVYVACWSLIASFPQVFAATFGQQTQLRALMTPIHNGGNLYRFFWMETLLRNPLFYLYALWAIGTLAALGRAQSPRETLLLFYGCTVGLIVLNIRQPWPYMFVILAPTAFVLHAYLFAREMRRPESVLSRPLLWVCYAMLGLALPLSRVPAVAHDDPGLQRQTVRLAEALLEPGDRYFAGTQLLYRGHAHETALGMVDTNAARPIHSLPPAEHAAILERFKKEPVRFIVYTSTIDDGVPQLIRDHLFRSYAPFWANVWIYAPQLKPAESEISLLFTGSYRVETKTPGTVQIDGKPHADGETVELERGRHRIATSVRFRLRLQPRNIGGLLDPDYRDVTSFFWPDMGPAPEHIRNGVWLDD